MSSSPSPRFLDLTPEDLDHFVARAQAHDGPWIFHHIPKTAGSSLVNELSNHARPYENIVPDYSERIEPLEDAMNARIGALATRIRDGVPQPRSISGHLTAPQFDSLREMFSPDARSFTFLRHPVARIYSEYNYCLTPRHPPYRAFAERYPDISDFIADPVQRNKCAWYMFGTDQLPVEEALERMNRTYEMVGLQERYPVGFLLLSAMVWTPTLPVSRERTAVSKVTPDPAIVHQIKASNALDLALFDAVLAVYSRLGPAIWARFRPTPIDAGSKEGEA